MFFSSDSSPSQLPEALELHRVAYVDFARSLLAAQLEEQRGLLSFAQAREVAEQCGFVGDGEAIIALRVMEQVHHLSLSFFHIFHACFMVLSAQWMISCKLTNSVPAMVVLNVEWLSLLLFELLHPEEAVVLEAGGVLSQRRLFDRWLRKALLESHDLCLAFLLCLSELHVWREEHNERFPEEEAGVILVPHAMNLKPPPCMAEAVRQCISLPHGGWRAKPLEGEESGEMSFSFSLPLFSLTLKEDSVCRRRVVDPVVFSQLLLYLKSTCSMPVLIPCRRVGLVQVDPKQARWFLVCWTHSSIMLSAVDCAASACSPVRGQARRESDAQPPVRETPVSSAPLCREAYPLLYLLHRSVELFLRQRHPLLWHQLLPLPLEQAEGPGVCVYCSFFPCL